VKLRTITATITLPTSPDVVYSALLDSKKHSTFTGSKAVIGKKIGDSFSVYDGYATGRQLELIPSKLLVQTWRASDWPAGHYSTVSFELMKRDGKTILHFQQTEIPDSEMQVDEKAWEKYYWKPLKEYFKRS